MLKMLLAAAALVSSIILPAHGAWAEDQTYTVIIKDNKFSPAEITIPADTKIKLIVDNQDATPEEFESHDLNREKVIPGNSKATLMLGPLDKGRYSYFGEFHEATAKGVIIVE